MRRISVIEQLLKPFLLMVSPLVLFFLASCESRFFEGDGSPATHRYENPFNTVAKASAIKLYLDPAAQKGNLVPFQTHDNALAMNIPYRPIADLRQQLEKQLRHNLKFLQSWNPQGEAHITVITPPEFDAVLSKNISMDEINEIAVKENIQLSDVKVLGLGSGKAILDDSEETTFFILVSSSKLHTIRQSIHAAFVAKGGAPESWDYKTFYPHITVGFTKRDLHLQDGVIKDVEHSLDERFQLLLRPGTASDTY